MARIPHPMLLLAAAAGLLGGCGHPHPVPDQRLVTELRAAIVLTLQASGQEPLSAKQLDDESVELAWATDPVRIQRLRDGTLARAQLLGEARALPALIAGRHAGQPPVLLLWLLAHGQDLGPGEEELLEALRAQAQLELAKDQR